MSAQIAFYAGQSFSLTTLGAYGLGFYGDAGFGSSVAVGAWQGRTFQTSADGTYQGFEASNVKYVSPTGAILGQTGTPLSLNQIPNYESSINMRFSNDTPVRTQNAQLYIYDGVTPTNPPSGVTCAVYECTHTATSQTATGSGGPGTPVISGVQSWFLATGGAPMAMTASPGTSGNRPSGSSTVDSQHDFFLALANSPNSIGSKNYALLFSLEYL